jgi:NitT/TauT family transport system substrate-binding protein
VKQPERRAAGTQPGPGEASTLQERYGEQKAGGSRGRRKRTKQATADAPVGSRNANAAGSDIAMGAMLRKHGLEDKRDYTVVEAPFPTMRAMLAEKKVDLIPAVLPFSADPELRKIGRTLFDTKDAVGVSQFSMWVARKRFIDKHRGALTDFMEDSLRIVR